MLVTALAAVGCADTATEPEVGEPIVLTTPDPQIAAEQPADVMTAPHLVELVRLTETACAEQLMIDTPNFGNTDVSEPLVTETFGPDGCADERWIREWDGTTPLTETYGWFDPALAHHVYVQPFAYEHTWTYDAAGRVVMEERTPLENDPTHNTWVEETEYDAHGRITRQYRGGSPLQPVIDWSQEDLYTYGPHSDEFETHTSISNGDVWRITRQVFRPDGQLVERHVESVSHGAPERLVLRREYDADGNLTLEETWRDVDGVAHMRRNFERRADGTLEREVSEDLQFGRLDVTTYDEAERQLVYTQDDDLDGAIDYRKEDRYDADGNLVFTSTEYDFDRPQTRYAETVFEYDARGRMTKQVSTPVYLDGKSLRTTNVYDARGPGYVSTFDRLDESGNLEQTERVTRFISPERVAWERLDSTRDGVLNSLTIRRWAGERPVERLSDHDGDGVLDSIEQWHYDGAGQLTLHVQDADADTIVDSGTIYAR